MRGRQILFASDLDGTIVDGNGQVPDKIRFAIDRLQDAGVIFAAATGRGPQSVARFELPFLCPAIFENGGKVLFPNGHSLRTFPFSRSERRRLAQLVRQESDRIAFAFTVKPGIRNYSFLALNQETWKKVSNRFDDVVDTVTTDIPTFTDDLLRGSVRLVLVGDIGIPTKGFNHSYGFDEVGLTFHHFNRRGANKGTGVRLVAEHLGISQEDVIVAGNDYNDMSMFRHNFGVRLAVGPTCPPYLLSRATHYSETMEDLPLILRGLVAEIRGDK